MLTDYERLAEFVPNLERCERLPKGPNGRVILRQVIHIASHRSSMCQGMTPLCAHVHMTNSDQISGHGSVDCQTERNPSCIRHFMRFGIL